MNKNTVHIVLQGKGGVGKSLVASFLVQYLQQKHRLDECGPVLCIDTDPVNRTLSRYQDFAAIQIDLLNDAQSVDTRRFDDLVDLNIEHDGPAVVDNGASTFIAFTAYLAENDAFGILKQHGSDVTIHVVITGGQALDDTIGGLLHVLATQTVPVVVWQNNYFGEVAKDGLPFAESAIYKNSAGKIIGLINLERGTHDTFGKDIAVMVQNHITFERALASAEHFGASARSRIQRVRDNIFGQLADVIG